MLPVALLATALLAGPLPAQTGAPHGAPTKTIQTGHVNVLAQIPGQVRDLTRDSAGRILYCTSSGEVGRVDPAAGTVTVLANAASGPFPNPLRALAETPSGDIAVLDVHGHIRVLVGGVAPAVLRYNDVFMIQDASDLIVDARGSFLIASATPSNGKRGMNWVSANGQRWSYYMVKDSPLQLAADPLTGAVVVSDSTNGGALVLVDSEDLHRPTSALDLTTKPGPSAIIDDGDLAIEADGDLWWAANGKLLHHSRKDAETHIAGSGYDALRGIVIANASGHLWAPSGWSLYLAEGENPTKLMEIPNVGEPGSLIADDQGEVPTRGQPVNVLFGMQCFELTADNQGRLLIGGALWGSPAFVKRITLTPTPSITTVASTSNGLAGLIEGLVVAPDDSIYALSREGTIQRITEGPLSITNVFTDPAAQIEAGKDMVRDVNGSLYVATRESWGFGKVLEVSGGTASLLAITAESRGLAAGLNGGMFVSQWHNVAFNGTVDRLRFSDHVLEPQPGFATMNYTNDHVWADGDLAVDVNGSVYTVSEDDWSLVRYDPAVDGFVRFGSSYLNHPSGLAIAASTPGSGSTTGWSLYVSEFDFLWEKPSVPAPASTLVDASLGLLAGGRHVAVTIHPRFGKPRTTALDQDGATVLISTSESYVLAADPLNGEVRVLAGPDRGLHGDLVALARVPGTGRILVANREAELFELRSGKAAPRWVDPARLRPVIQRFLEAPRRWLRIGGQDFVLDGWVVWGL